MSADDLAEGEDVGAAPGWAQASIAPRRRGKGKRTLTGEAFERWFAEQGMTDPLVMKSRLISADPVELQAYYASKEQAEKMLGEDRALVLPSLHDIIAMQLKAAEALAPYLHRKKPIDVVIEDERLPTLIINMGSNQLATAEQIAAGQGLRIDVQPEPASINEIKGLSVGRIAEASNGRKGKAKE
jgi:hypothetical protein